MINLPDFSTKKKRFEFSVDKYTEYLNDNTELHFLLSLYYSEESEISKLFHKISSLQIVALDTQMSISLRKVPLQETIDKLNKLYGKYTFSTDLETSKKILKKQGISNLYETLSRGFQYNLLKMINNTLPKVN